MTLHVRPAPSGTIQFEVVDAGIGIAKDALKKLFNVFSQADSSTTRKFGGTGLGLSICRRLMEGMGGELYAESVEGKGSRFWFVIPLHEGQEQGLTARAQVRTISPWQDARILVADDNAVNLKVVTHFLQSMGYHTDTVKNGCEVLKALKVKSYELVLLDCHMPEMNGYECARALR